MIKNWYWIVGIIIVIAIIFFFVIQ